MCVCHSVGLQGTLKGFDQTVNVILEDCTERTYDPVQGVEQVPLGLYIIRGDNLYVLYPSECPHSVSVLFIFMGPI
jgi:small nuclear ribonucleoprotein (snRNP)-like protein